MDWDCKQNDFFIKGADDAGSQHRKQEAISTSHHSARGEAAGKPGRSGPALSISQRGLDYLIANRRLPIRRIGGGVLVPVADLPKYARGDHPEKIVA
jgi:hypothetical protein